MWCSLILALCCWSAPSINTVTSLHLYLRNVVSNSVATRSLYCQCGWERGAGLHLTLGLICPTTDTWLYIDTTLHTCSINIQWKHQTWTATFQLHGFHVFVLFLLQPSLPTLSRLDTYIVFFPLDQKWQFYRPSFRSLTTRTFLF